MTAGRPLWKNTDGSRKTSKLVRFGPTFKRPSERGLRKLRNGNGPKMSEADEIRKLLDAAPTELKALRVAIAGQIG